MIRVALVDDHLVVRDGLAQLLCAADDLELAGTAADGFGALELVRREAPDVLLMDLSMPGMDGVEATRRIVASGAGTRVVVLTSSAERDRILSAIDAGAWGYLLKDAEPAELFRGIRAAAAGEVPLAPRAARVVLESRRSNGTGGTRGGAALTDREREVLNLVAAGLINKQIGARLGISEATVKAHLTSIFARIGVADRTQAALWAERRGLTGAGATNTA